jgi:FG-GAP-like repeat
MQKLMRQILIGLGFFLSIGSVHGQNGFIQQEWKGAWGSDGPIFTGDLNGDGKTDVFMWRNSTHSWTVNISNGNGFEQQEWQGAWGSDGPIFTGDLNGDGKTDVFMWRNSTHSWTVNISTGKTFIQQEWTGAWGSDGPIFTGDLNGDGRTDVFMWRNSTHSWTVNISSGKGFIQQEWTGAWGSDGPIFTGDLNGDGKTDVFMWRGSTHSWTINLSNGKGFIQQEWKGAWGSDGPIFTGDLDGDGKTDVFMWRGSTNSWTVNISSGKGFTQQEWFGACLGNEVPVVGDFNGDHKTDIAVWRDNSKEWKINLSTGNGFDFRRWQGAWASDGPVFSGDLNGDGRHDIFMWRNSTNSWTLNLSKGIGTSHAATACQCGQKEVDPQNTNGADDSQQSYAGRAIQVTGDPKNLYVVGLYSGIWRNGAGQSGNYGSWTQLPGCPRNVNTLAVDLNNSQHLVVGQRVGDDINPLRSKSGVWESFDGGQSFPAALGFDPTSIGAGGQLIRQVAISRQSTVFFASPFGLGRKASGAGTFSFVIPNQDITAISVFGPFVVARTVNSIFISANDGNTWTPAIAIPPTADTLTVNNLTHRSSQFAIAACTSNSVNNLFVYLPFLPVEDEGGKNCILVFDQQNNAWHSQVIKTVTFNGATIEAAGDGAGSCNLFIKSEFLPLYTGSNNGVGGQSQLVFSAGEDVFRATSVDNHGVPQWERFAAAVFPYGSPNPDLIHADLYDVHFDPTGTDAWISSDGGTYIKSPYYSSSASWKSLNQALYLHSINSVTAISDADSRSETTDIRPDNIAYVCTDNDGWVRNDKGIWFTPGNLGDGNWATSDQTSPAYRMIARAYGIANFGDFSTSKNVTISHDPSFMVNNFQFIQTLSTEPMQTSADVLMLANLPMTYVVNNVSNNLSGVLGTPNPKGLAVLIRNRHYELNPDINLNPSGTGWEVVFDDVPAGTSAFWISGGHGTNLVYFVHSVVNGVVTIYKRKGGDPSWTPLNTPPNVTQGNLNADAAGFLGAYTPYGPLFPNPYQPDIMYVSAADGIYLSTDGGSHFNIDPSLTALVSGHGRYAVGHHIRSNDVKFATNDPNEFQSSLSCMAFDRNYPQNVVASSVSSGVFFKRGSADWADLTGLLPNPFTPITSVSITDWSIYVGMYNRGLIQILDY